ncbi:CG3494 [Drosophila busckii]|uniref:CG3494 n=1 Tax=Drosophila busckii TaxID=30019 RepID=A0A0M4EH90_DROBS|nr:leucine-rich repeat-containing protein 40 [Drosophila busckii]ALC41897.1 CG3494 [Drosophila busckii]
MVGDGLNSPRVQGGKENTPGGEEDAAYGKPFPDKYSMRNTRSLTVHNAALTQVPIEVFEVACNEFVNIVDLTNNMLTQLPEGLKLLHELLTELTLSRNQLSFVPSYISQFSRLQALNLSCNLLSELPMELAGLQNLCELNISHNRLKRLPSCIYELINLESLIANDNKIKTLDVSDNGLGALPRLMVLNLANNDIQLVPPQLGNLMTISKLKLTGNPFRQPRHQIIEMGTAEIMKYLRGRIPL